MNMFDDFSNKNTSQMATVNRFEPKTHTTNPTVTGSAILGIVYDGGVMVTADTLGSFGRMHRFSGLHRMFEVTDKALMAASGDLADFQFIKEVIEQKVRDDECGGYTKVLDAGALHCWLTRVLYNRRSRFDPLWLECVVAGFRDDKPFLGAVDKLGTAYQSTELATGFGCHLVVPMMRELRQRKGGVISRDDARKVLIDGMKVLYYRDTAAFHKYQLADITPAGVVIEDEVSLKNDTNWQIVELISGYE